MHIYMMCRGIKHDMDRFIRELSSQYVKFKARMKGDTDLKDYMLQISVRPIQLYEVVFPEEHKDAMLNSLFGAPGIEKGSGHSQHKRHAKWIWAIRKMLGVEPIPKTWKTDSKLCFYGDNVEKIAIGMKEDYWKTKDDKHVSKKEEGSYEGI